MKPPLLVATRNQGKQREIRTLLADAPCRVVFPDEVGLYPEAIEDTIEDAGTFEGNAFRKADYFHRRSCLPTIGEDSGIEVFALGGEPGVRSRRFAMATVNQDEANNQELLRRLTGAPAEQRKAQYRCAVVLLANRGALRQTFEGRCEGRILETPDGDGGFGYDPLFFSDDLQQSFGQADPADKHRVSHRGRAFRQFLAWLTEHPVGS